MHFPWLVFQYRPFSNCLLTFPPLINIMIIIRPQSGQSLFILCKHFLLQYHSAPSLQVFITYSCSTGWPVWALVKGLQNFQSLILQYHYHCYSVIKHMFCMLCLSSSDTVRKNPKILAIHCLSVLATLNG